MRLRNLSGLIPALASCALAACGGGPNIDQVKADFENPSGSVNDKDAVVAAAGNQNASAPALAMVGGGVPGLSLTATGKRSAFAQIAPERMHGSAINGIRNYFGVSGRTIRSLSEAQVDDLGDFEDDGDSFGNGCDDAPEAKAAVNEALQDLIGDAALGGRSASGSASYSIDLSTCSGGELTGIVNDEIEIDVESDGQGGGSFRFKITREMVNVCETGGGKACVSGTFLLEVSARGFAQQSFGQAETIAAWELTATMDGKTLETKGGVRVELEGNETSGRARIEILAYAKASTGEEVSFVLTIEGNSSTGEVTLSYRGRDGQIYCTAHADGSGECRATNSDGAQAILTWTAAEYDQELEESFGG